MLHSRIGTKIAVHQLHELESGIGLNTSKTIHGIVEIYHSHASGTRRDCQDGFVPSHLPLEDPCLELHSTAKMYFPVSQATIEPTFPHA